MAKGLRENPPTMREEVAWTLADGCLAFGDVLMQGSFTPGVASLICLMMTEGSIEAYDEAWEMWSKIPPARMRRATNLRLTDKGRATLLV